MSNKTLPRYLVLTEKQKDRCARALVRLVKKIETAAQEWDGDVEEIMDDHKDVQAFEEGKLAAYAQDLPVLPGLQRALEIVESTGYTTAENAYAMCMRIRERIQAEIAKTK